MSILLTVAVEPDTLTLTWMVFWSPDTGTVTLEPPDVPPPPLLPLPLLPLLLLTVTVQVAVLPPSAVVTVMVAEPALTAVTFPLASTVATAVLLDAQVTALSVAPLGATVAVSRSEPPTVRVVLVLFSVTPVTAMVGSVTASVPAT